MLSTSAILNFPYMWI